MCVASSGIVAQLLPGGRTSYSRFKIPLNLDSSSVCSITCNSALGQLLQQTALIIWDEVPMQNKYCFEAVHRSVADVLGKDLESAIFGDIPILLGGDFAQILPVVRKGSRSQIVFACLQSSFLWPKFKRLSLKFNMRVRQGMLNEQFASFLLAMSYTPAMYGRLELPSYIRHESDLDAFCEQVFPKDLCRTAATDANAFANRAILALRNDTVEEFNTLLLQHIPGEEASYHAVNSADLNEAEEGVHQLPAEYLQTLNSAGIPPSHLRLKIGAPVILLRNLNPRNGLCNGTRLTITKLYKALLEAQIIGGQFHGQLRLIPRIKVSTTEGELPFILSRKQFPLRLCFAMTVNKAQGQSLDVVGIDLRSPPFSHGQLYVALSRVTDVNRLTLLSLQDGRCFTQNIVYPEVLLR